MVRSGGRGVLSQGEVRRGLARRSGHGEARRGGVRRSGHVMVGRGSARCGQAVKLINKWWAVVAHYTNIRNFLEDNICLVLIRRPSSVS